MHLYDILKILNTVAPFDTAEEWDNVGLMVGDPEQEINSILISLDAHFEVISYAIEANIDLIITHHPLFLQPIRTLDYRNPITKKVTRLIKAGISLVSMHTNLDIGQGGMADILASALNLKDVKTIGMIRAGKIGSPMPIEKWARSLPFENVRVVDAKRDVSLVGACPGSGMDYWRQAFEIGCDTFVTGDVRYHAAIDAWDRGMNVVDLGHFGTEEIAVKPLAEKLKEYVEGINILTYKGKDIFMSITGKENID